MQKSEIGILTAPRLADDTLVTLEKSYAKILKQKYDFLEKKGKS